MPSQVEKKGVGINPISQIHYVDHLAVVCIIMGIPLIFTDRTEESLAKKYYPGLDTLFIDHQELTPDYLISNYDVLFLSDAWDREVFHTKFQYLEEKYHKSIRHVHCPHGFSDKGFFLRSCVREDILLVYGDNMLDLFKHDGVFDQLKQYVLVGNYRYTYFKQNKQFFDRIIAEEVVSRFAKKQPIILYAPTWLDRHESSTFFDDPADILGRLPDHYNMIVKLHPRLEDEAGQFHYILGQYDHKPNIVFVKDFPLVYPLLAHSDIYLGDTSAIDYDFLVFNKPMFFLNKRGLNPLQDREAYIFRCGVDLKPDAYPLLYQIIEANINNDVRFSEIRQKVYEYSFGSERPFHDIKKEIIAAYSLPTA